MFPIIFGVLFYNLIFASVTIKLDDPLDKSYYKLSDQEYNIVQSAPNGTVYWQPFNFDTDKYITIELIFKFPSDGWVNLLFTCTKNGITTIVDRVVNASYTDFNGYYLKKNYHMITIPPYSFKGGDSFYFTMIIQNIVSAYQYTLKITKSLEYQCYNDCTSPSIGFCVKEITTCGCEANRVDLDCSKTAQALMLGQKLDRLSLSGNKYFYFEMVKQMSKIVLDISILQYTQDVKGYFMFENFKYGVPTANYNDFSFSFTKDSMSKTFLIDLKQLKYNDYLYRFARLIISLELPTDMIGISVGVSEPSVPEDVTTNLMLIYFLVGLAVILLLTWIIITVIRYRQARTRIYDEERVHQIRQRQMPEEGMNQKIVDEYLPKKSYANIVEMAKHRHKEQQLNDTCSVCLLEYDERSICRFTPCLHIFHEDCLSQWILKHETCPLCRSELTLAELKKRKQEENELQQSLLNPLIGKNRKQQLIRTQDNAGHFVADIIQ